MATKTFNLGRVVGWSSYEEFLQENPDVDPSKVSRYVYETLVTYGVARVVALSSDAWQPSNGGKFYVQTVRVPGASWGSVPIVGLHYDHYLGVAINPQGTGMTPEEKEAAASGEVNDVVDKTALESAVGSIFEVYVSDENGCKMRSSIDAHGYLTFLAHPDILKFQENVPGLAGQTLQLIVRGLSLEELVVDELYFGPQGFIFAGNGMGEDCFHRTENANNLMLMASSYVEFAISGNASSNGGAYKYYRAAEIQLEGLVTGYVDLNTLEDEGYLFNASEISSFINAATLTHSALTTSAYDVIADKNDYSYMVYGSGAYDDFPESAGPMYILCIRKTDGYTGLGVMLDFKGQARLGYDAQNPESTPERTLNLLHCSGTGSGKVITLKDKHMPDYLGCYWGQNNGWTGPVSYLQQNGLSEIEWSTLKTDFNAQFTDVGRNSYITLTPQPTRTTKIHLGDVFLIRGTGDPGEDMTAIRGLYVCTESSDTDPFASTIVLSRRGGYLLSDAEPEAPTVPVTYTRLPQWSYIYQAPASGDPYLVGDFDDGNRIYQNEMIFINQNGDPYGFSGEWQVVNLATDGNADLIVRTSQALPLSDTSSGISAYTGSAISSLTNAIKRTSIADLLPTTISVNDSPFSETTQSYTITRGGNADKLTVGTLVQLKHTVGGVFGADKSYWYQYLGTIDGAVVLASSVSQKDGTNFYTLAKMTSHLNQGFPRAKQSIPDGTGSYYYNYPLAMSRISVQTFFDDFDLDIADYLHPDYRNTSLLEFLQNLIIYKDLGAASSITNKKTLGFSAQYRFFTKSEALSTVTTQPTEQNPTRASLLLQASTDATSFTSPGFFTAQHIDPHKNESGIWIDNPTDEPHNIANPDYPIWATIAKSKSGAQTMSISMIDALGSRLNDSGSEGAIDADTITPRDLLVGLAIGKSVDNLKGLRVKRAGSGNYLETPDGVRLYLSSTEPDPDLLDIPVGSIGIGW